ncbi:MAG: hypothetical protein Q8926_01180 [Bacteroidota bacterium]|nr:hypothetical protein [Bacteroidota bacterium]
MDDLEHKLDKEITAKEKSQSSSLIQQKLFKKEWAAETRLKEIQIADAITEAKEIERSDLGKELHDNVNQLLAASRIYLDIGRRNEVNRELNLTRSSEYTLTAIEEIRKLAKGLINDAIQNIGLCDAIHKMTQDLMEVYPIKISCTMDSEIHTRMSAKFNQDVFRIVQEQLNNIIKHAKASVVKIDLSQNNDTILLSIADNGSGFDVMNDNMRFRFFHFIRIRFIFQRSRIASIVFIIHKISVSLINVAADRPFIHRPGCYKGQLSLFTIVTCLWSRVV